jgi:hypothetical protein
MTPQVFSTFKEQVLQDVENAMAARLKELQQDSLKKS